MTSPSTVVGQAVERNPHGRSKQQKRYPQRYPHITFPSILNVRGRQREQSIGVDFNTRICRFFRRYIRDGMGHGRVMIARYGATTTTLQPRF